MTQSAVQHLLKSSQQRYSGKIPLKSSFLNNRDGSRDGGAPQPPSGSQEHHQVQSDTSTWLARKHPDAGQPDHSQLDQPRAIIPAGSQSQNRGARQKPVLDLMEAESDLPDTPFDDEFTTHQFVDGGLPHSQMATANTREGRVQGRLDEDTDEAPAHDAIYPRPDMGRSMRDDNQLDSNNRKDPSIRLSPHSVENIRRVHELVALYRCRFKPNLSDASVMGTLHSAASVIQIHFRYLSHLREAMKSQPANKEPTPTPVGPSYIELVKDDDLSSGYINSEEDRNDELPEHALDRFN